MLYHITFTGVRRMKKSPYDRERFFEKYSQMDRSRLGLAGAGEWESLEPLLPDFAGKRVLDLGCGYGWHCIYAAEHGAASVTGVDLSEKMLAVAREKTTAPQVTYIYWLFKKKNVNTMKLILLVIALSVALSFLGIM